VILLSFLVLYFRVKLCCLEFCETKESDKKGESFLDLSTKFHYYFIFLAFEGCVSYFQEIYLDEDRYSNTGTIIARRVQKPFEKIPNL